MKKKILIVCTTDSMIWNFLIPHIEELKKKGYNVECASSVTGDYFNELTDKFHIKMHQINFVRTPFSVQNISAYKELKKLIKENHYDIIFCHEPVGGMMGRLAGKACHKKVIYMAHGFHFFKGAPFKHWLLYYTAECVLSFLTDVCITINKEDYHRARHMHAKRNYYIHGIGIQPKIENSLVAPDELKRKLGILENDFVLITVGELSERKNHQVILRALHKINNTDIKLIICGEGSLKIELKKLCRQLNIAGQIIFTGFVKNVGDYLNISNAFIYPSLFEGLGIAGLEAMKKGLPVIGSNRRGIRDYIINGKTGLLFEPMDIDKLAEEIKMLMNNRVLSTKLSNNAFKVLPIYSLDNVKKELGEIYKKEFI